MIIIIYKRTDDSIGYLTIIIRKAGLILKMTDKIMCVGLNEQEIPLTERTSCWKGDFKPFLSLLPLGTRTELPGGRLYKQDWILFITKN